MRNFQNFVYGYTSIFFGFLLLAALDNQILYIIPQDFHFIPYVVMIALTVFVAFFFLILEHSSVSLVKDKLKDNYSHDVINSLQTIQLAFDVIEKENNSDSRILKQTKEEIKKSTQLLSDIRRL